LVARFGEERNSDGDQKHHRPGGGKTHVLLLVPAERLHLIDVGDLEGEHRQQCDTEDRGEVIPGKAVAWHDIDGVDRKAHADDQRRLDQADQAGEHDRRISGLIGLLGQGARAAGESPRVCVGPVSARAVAATAERTLGAVSKIALGWGFVIGYTFTASSQPQSGLATIRGRPCHG
jgi:hypothetical protein